MAAMGSAAELSEYSRSHPAWSACAAHLTGGVYIGRIELESALWTQFRSDYHKLLAFLPRRDEALMAFPVLLQEQRAILLLPCGASRRDCPPAGLPRTILRSRLDLRALAACTSFDGLIAAAGETIYAPALRRLRTARAEEFPDYAAAETLLRSAYFSHIYRVIHQNYRGETRSLLLRSFGEQIDWLNLMTFSGSNPLPRRAGLSRRPLPLQLPPAARVHPFPLCRPGRSGRPGPASGHPLCLESFWNMGTRRPWRIPTAGPFYTFNRRQLTAATPSVYTAVAFLNLKELELHALVSLIESGSSTVSPVTPPSPNSPAAEGPPYPTERR